ncbi:uroporphyrinogen-III synthase [Swaminathania salitolerans]|uniref:Uroporphyrinogen-III synthase n=1 Tax=Swaminathania salitolerans TaxID=182838 RepID=A0A511BNT3_9PROT|nr:uroporphyrinogen-III synthase [Swaminathania salitolerans]GBQ15837.1 uroporphyrinogen-III synthase [Swaminathania salitolerans LMG 21291]GEL01503.1 uroporphyrinogen III methyltransferase [Swaminathania salitolerans]
MAEGARAGVLVTRPEPGLSDTMTELARRGWSPCAAPMLHVIPLPLKGATRFGRVVVTSGQSLNSLAATLPHDIALTAVGRKTAERARACGFTSVDHAGGTALSLVPHLGEPCGDPTLLLATGRHLGQDLARDLRNAGWSVSRRVVYMTQPVGHLSSSVCARLSAGEIGAALFYSAATAQAFLRAVGERRTILRTITALALSTQIADVLAEAPFAAVRTAEHPDQDSLLSLLDSPAHGPLHATEKGSDA